MGKARKFAKKKKMLNLHKQLPSITEEEEKEDINEDPQFTEYFAINHNLRPPYNIILDTNFINHSIRRKIDIEEKLIKCLYGRVIIHIPECVIGELEKLGRTYRVALAITRTPRFKTLTCDHKGTYADDCIIDRVTSHRCYVVATCDTGLKQRIRKIPGVPIVYVKGREYDVERLPSAPVRR